MQTVEAVELSDYEKERGKPRPNIIHGMIQAFLGVQFSKQVADRFLIVPELTLEIAPGSSLTPDLTVLPKRLLDGTREPARCRDIPPMVVEIVSTVPGPRGHRRENRRVFRPRGAERLGDQSGPTCGGHPPVGPGGSRHLPARRGERPGHRPDDPGGSDSFLTAGCGEIIDEMSIIPLAARKKPPRLHAP